MNNDLDGFSIRHIVCMSKNRVIGSNGSMPWKFAKELAHFKKTTFNNPIIMGRKTWQSLPAILPGRTHYVLSSNPNLQLPASVYRCSSIKDAFDKINKSKKHWTNSTKSSTKNSQKIIFIIGGQEIFHHTIDIIDSIDLTIIDHEFPGDSFYPIVEDKFTVQSSKKIADHNSLQFNNHPFISQKQLVKYFNLNIFHLKKTIHRQTN